jgi:hypothetical protein
MGPKVLPLFDPVGRTRREQEDGQPSDHKLFPSAPLHREPGAGRLMDHGAIGLLEGGTCF